MFRKCFHFSKPRIPLQGIEVQCSFCDRKFNFYFILNSLPLTQSLRHFLELGELATRRFLGKRQKIRLQDSALPLNWTFILSFFKTFCNNSKILFALPFNWIFLETHRNSRKHEANTIAFVRTFHIFVLVLAKLTLTQYFRWSLENNIFWNSCMWKTEGAHFVVARIWYISRLIQVRDRMNINQSTMPNNTYLILS